MIKGSCHCQKVQFTVNAPVQGIIHCHCRTCQKLSGTSFGATVFVAADEVTFTGKEYIKEYQSSANKVRAFCGECGTPLYSLVPETGKMGLRAGVFDTDPGVQSKMHIWLEDERPWFEVATDLPKFDQFP